MDVRRYSYFYYFTFSEFKMKNWQFIMLMSAIWLVCAMIFSIGAEGNKLAKLEMIVITVVFLLVIILCVIHNWGL